MSAGVYIECTRATEYLCSEAAALSFPGNGGNSSAYRRRRFEGESDASGGERYPTVTPFV